MTRDLLVRGMLAGLLAAVLATLFAQLAGEPQVDLAIGFEAARDHAMGMAAEPELVSRAVQRGIGLFTAVALYGAAVGGIFSLVFAAAYGRLGQIGPRTLALLLALGAMVAISLVPAIKYPPNPPSVGLHETIQLRTATYFILIGLSLAGLALGVMVGRRAASKVGAFNGVLSAAAVYVVFVVGVELVLPMINEVPEGFPAVILWRFRVAAIGVQLVLWLALGVGFGWLADRRLRRT